MIERFETGKWYRWTSPQAHAFWNLDTDMKKMLDGKPHLCTYAKGWDANFEDIEPPKSVVQEGWHWGTLENFEEVDMGIQGQIDKLKEEIERLEKMVAEEKMPIRVVFDGNKLYCVERKGWRKYVLISEPGELCNFFGLNSTRNRKGDFYTSEQEALDDIASKGFTIHTFDTKKEALTFMLEQE